jgi:ribulose-phosphate 3-epimerase
MPILAPSILAADMTNLSQQIRRVEMGGANWIHCDIMDGHFVPNISFGPMIVEAARRITRLPLDVHLMIQNPDKYIESFVEAGASIISVHYEEVIHLNSILNKIRKLGAKAGVVINPSTTVGSLRDVVEYADLVLIMSVNPGFGGQIFIPNSLRKIEEAVKLREEMKADFVIEVDGGIELHNVKDVLLSGCDAFVIGSSIFKSEDVTTTTLEFKNIINSKNKVIT